MKKVSISAGKDKPRTADTSSEFGSQKDSFSANQFDVVFSRIMEAVGSKKDVDLANALGISPQSVYGVKNRQKIPDGWYAIIADKFDVSMDWLRTGEGEMRRGAAPAATERTAQQADAQGCHIYGNASARRDVSIADMLTKTARVLESDTVYREALYSNIEAFHHGVTMDERLGKMDAKFDQVMQRLDALESENQQLRQELEHSRAQSTVRDTG